MGGVEEVFFAVFTPDRSGVKTVIEVSMDFPRLSGHKKCREGVHFKNQEKSDG
jgi:hypothetical protein